VSRKVGVASQIVEVASRRVGAGGTTRCPTGGTGVRKSSAP